jgi:DNA-binding transcriptional LysR family regulator
MRTIGYYLKRQFGLEGIVRGSEFAELQAFVTIAEKGSFVRAAGHLRIAPSSLSQTIKNLETRIGVDLLRRTTRTVELTSAGLSLLNRFRPAMVEMEAAVSDLHDLEVKPSGIVRLHLPRSAFNAFLEPRLGDFYRAFPKIELDITVDDVLVDVNRSSFDLDVRLGNTVNSSLSIVRIGQSVRHTAVASQSYLEANGTPIHPSQLHEHRCIQSRRQLSGPALSWTFNINSEPTTMELKGPLIVSHCDLAVTAAVQSVGIAFVLQHYSAGAVADGRLVSILESFLPTFEPWAICYPRLAKPSAATRSIIQFLEAYANGLSSSDRPERGTDSTP